MNNPSGSEFTLRVAICDLVERLKRMQHKCSYLEECRNQLVKEVIRLRLQNEWLGKQMTVDCSSAHPSLMGPGGGGGQLTGTPAHCNSCTLVSQPVVGASSCHYKQQPPVPQSSSLVNHSPVVGKQRFSVEQLASIAVTSDKQSSPQAHQVQYDEKDQESINLMNILNDIETDGDLDNQHDSIKLLLIQMLKDMELESKTGQLKNDLIQFIRNSSSSNKLPKLEDGSTNFPKPVHNNSLIKFDMDDLVDDDHSTNQSSDQQHQSRQHKESDNYEAFNNNSDYYTNSHNLNINDLQYLDESRHRSNALAPDSKVSDKKNSSEALGCVHDPILNGKANGSEQQLTNEELFQVVQSVSHDVKSMYQSIVESTDKLNKLKSKQLRHFFQKQIT